MNYPTWTSPDGRIRLINADCLDVLRSLDDGIVDATVTSPPYNQNINTFKPSGMQKNWRWADKIASGYFDSLTEIEYREWQKAVLSEVFRITADGGSCFYNHKLRWRDGELLHPIDIVRDSPFEIRQEIIWRRDGSATLNARMFAPCDERIYWLRKGRHRWNQDCVGYMSVWDINSVKSADHACAFPVEIPDRCIRATTNSGDLVFEPYSGSGTVAVACARTDRRCIAVEKDAEYFARSVKRLEREYARTALFDHAGTA